MRDFNEMKQRKEVAVRTVADKIKGIVKGPVKFTYDEDRAKGQLADLNAALDIIGNSERIIAHAYRVYNAAYPEMLQKDILEKFICPRIKRTPRTVYNCVAYEINRDEE